MLASRQIYRTRAGMSAQREVWLLDTGSPWLTTARLATAGSYNGSQESDLRPFFAFTIVAASLRLHDENSNDWQVADSLNFVL